MKRILVICLSLMLGAGLLNASAEAQQKTKKTVTTVFATDIECAHCAKKIMDNVPALGKGVKDVKVDVDKKEVTVVYDAQKSSDDAIIKGLASLKVKAQVKDAGKACCKSGEKKACGNACCGNHEQGKKCDGTCGNHEQGKKCDGSCDKKCEKPEKK